VPRKNGPCVEVAHARLRRDVGFSYIFFFYMIYVVVSFSFFFLLFVWREIFAIPCRPSRPGQCALRPRIFTCIFGWGVYFRLSSLFPLVFFFFFFSLLCCFLRFPYSLSVHFARILFQFCFLDYATVIYFFISAGPQSGRVLDVPLSWGIFLHQVIQVPPGRPGLILAPSGLT